MATLAVTAPSLIYTFVIIYKFEQATIFASETYLNNYNLKCYLHL
jgi:hypothetical protein